MKLSPSHFTDPDAVARKLVQIANASEAVQDGRIYIEPISNPFLNEGGTSDQYRAARSREVRSAFSCRVAPPSPPSGLP